MRCQAVFKDKESLIGCMKELKEKDQGISIGVSGLFDEVFDCCNKAGIKPTRIEFALGDTAISQNSPRWKSWIS